MADVIDNPPIESNSLTSDGILDILSEDNTDDEKLPDDKEEKPLNAKEDKGSVKDSEDEEDKSEKEDDKEIKVEGNDDDELELSHISRKQILKEFPELFKKFPSLEKSLYRNEQYSEIFPTIQEARDSKEAAENFQQFENQLLNGSPTGMLKSVKDADPQAFEKIVEGFLPALAKVDNNARSIVMSQVLKGTVITMYQEGKNRNLENLQKAAEILHEFCFGTNQITRYQEKYKIEDRPDPKVEQLNNREQQFMKQQFDVAINDVSGRTENVIKATIDKHIDPRNNMSPYVRSKATSDVLEQLDRSIKEDKSFSATLDRLWQKALDEDFSHESKERIRKALLSKSQTILPDILRRVRADAQKGNVVRNKVEREEEDDSPVEKERPVMRSREATANKSTGKSKDGRGMKTADFFAMD